MKIKNNLNNWISLQGLFLLSLLLTGCGSFVPTAKIDQMSAEQRHAINSVEIINQTQLINKNFKVVGIVEGHSCMNKMWDPPATRMGAIEQIKVQVVDMKGDGITNIQCGGKEGTSVATNCWQLVSCTAEVIKFNK